MKSSHLDGVVTFLPSYLLGNSLVQVTLSLVSIQFLISDRTIPLAFKYTQLAYPLLSLSLHLLPLSGLLFKAKRVVSAQSQHFLASFPPDSTLSHRASMPLSLCH